MIAEKFIQDYLDESLINKILISNVPDTTLGVPCIMGIDEAGRGPVLGPMVYAIAYYPHKMEESLNKMKFADSKALSESARESLFSSIDARESGFREIGYVAKVISPNMISNCMLRRKKYNLNALSHDTAIELINKVKSLGVDVAHVYIDTVGPPAPYKEKLKTFFPSISFTVTEKADSKFSIVSAASVCAKVLRDRIVNKWRYLESESLYLQSFELGSGYPSDPTTKKFLDKSIDPVFGYPTLARFSWSTVTKALEKSGVPCDWNDDEDEQEKNDLKKLKNYWRNLASRSLNQKTPSSGTQLSCSTTKQMSGRRLVTNADKFLEDRLLSRIA